MRILFVDDEAGIQSIVRLSLERLGGHTVQICDSGINAIKIAPVFKPDLIILDVTMPGMDGTDTLKALRHIPETTETPIIFMTASANQEEITQYKEMGAVDVIPKPFDPMTLPGTINRILGQHSIYQRAHIQGQYNAIQREFIENLQIKIHRIDDMLKGLETGGWENYEVFKEMHLIAHSLSGSGKTFGFPDISEAAHNLELLIKAVIEGNVKPSAEEQRQIGRALDILKDASAEPVQTIYSIRHERPLSLLVSRGKEDRILFLLEDDALFARELALQIGYFGYRVHTFPRLEGLKDALSHTTPTAIIADITSSKDESTSLKAVAEINQLTEAQIPIIFISARDDFETRLRAVRTGGYAYFTRPFDVSTLIDRLDMLYKTQETYRILIVDDDFPLAEYYRLILENAGMTVSVITDPLQAMESLSEFRPDLILMDVYMPGCTGLELAKVIRQQDSFVGIPIVFLSSETDIERQLIAMSLGGDDFLTKPIRPEHLISAVTARVERGRVLRSFMIHDSLTGLLNHTNIKKSLDIEVARAERQKTSLVFALIDIDHFKSVNDTYGHSTGDQVIKSLSRLLQQRLRKSDTIGRYGGEEFAIILGNTDGKSAIKILNKIREDFSQLKHHIKGIEFSVTFSCGIAPFPLYRHSSELIDAADRALYEAKGKGRNRVVLAPGIG